MELIRTVGNVHYTPIIRYEGGGRCVDLVGMIHVAEKSYFRRIRKYLKMRTDQGFRVLYEGLLFDQDGADHDEASRLMRELLHALDSMYGKMVRRFNLSHQYDQMQLRGDWVHADISGELFMQLLRDEARKSPNFVRDFQRSIASLHDENAIDEFIESIRAGNDGIDRHLKSPDLQAFFHVILHARNQHALNVLAEQAANAPVVMPWGAAHLTCFAELLESQGLKCTSIEWLRAFRSSNR